MQDEAWTLQRELRLPPSGGTPEQQAQWRARGPVRELDFPLLHLPVKAKAIGPSTIYVYWGNRTFGEIDPVRMQIKSASD